MCFYEINISLFEFHNLILFIFVLFTGINIKLTRIGREVAISAGPNFLALLPNSTCLLKVVRFY